MAPRGLSVKIIRRPALTPDGAIVFPNVQEDKLGYRTVAKPYVSGVGGLAAKSVRVESEYGTMSAKPALDADGALVLVEGASTCQVFVRAICRNPTCSECTGPGRFVALSPPDVHGNSTWDLQNPFQQPLEYLPETIVTIGPFPAAMNSCGPCLPVPHTFVGIEASFTCDRSVERTSGSSITVTLPSAVECAATPGQCKVFITAYYQAYTTTPSGGSPCGPGECSVRTTTIICTSFSPASPPPGAFDLHCCTETIHKAGIDGIPKVPGLSDNDTHEFCNASVSWSANAQGAITPYDGVVFNAQCNIGCPTQTCQWLLQQPYFFCGVSNEFRLAATDPCTSQSNATLLGLWAASASAGVGLQADFPNHLSCQACGVKANCTPSVENATTGIPRDWAGNLSFEIIGYPSDPAEICAMISGWIPRAASLSGGSLGGSVGISVS